MTEPRVIRKYANRRLYDTLASQHINKDGVRDLIARGEEIQVIDDATGHDITRNMLLQIVSEQELGGQPVLSDALLTQIIRFYGHPMQGMLGDFLQRSFEMFVSQQKTIQDQMQKMISQGPLAAMQDMAARSMESWFGMQGTANEPDKNKEPK